MIEEIKSKIGDAQLVVVSKKQSTQKILEVYNQGQRVFGENRVEELIQKHSELPQDIEWHMIGNLQSRRVKDIVPIVSMIQSVDRLKILKEIDKQAAKIDNTIDILLQFKIAQEDAKSGFLLSDYQDVIDTIIAQNYANIRVRGLMAMATNTDDIEQITSEFISLKNLFEKIKKEYPDLTHFDTLSMGMSGDYNIAIEQGSSMIRLGSVIFNP